MKKITPKNGTLDARYAYFYNPKKETNRGGVYISFGEFLSTPRLDSESRSRLYELTYTPLIDVVKNKTWDYYHSHRTYMGENIWFLYKEFETDDKLISIRLELNCPSKQINHTYTVESFSKEGSRFVIAEGLSIYWDVPYGTYRVSLRNNQFYPVKDIEDLDKMNLRFGMEFEASGLTYEDCFMANEEIAKDFLNHSSPYRGAEQFKSQKVQEAYVALGFKKQKERQNTLDDEYLRWMNDMFTVTQPQTVIRAVNAAPQNQEVGTYEVQIGDQTQTVRQAIDEQTRNIRTNGVAPNGRRNPDLDRLLERIRPQRGRR